MHAWVNRAKHINTETFRMSSVSVCPDKLKILNHPIINPERLKKKIYIYIYFQLGKMQNYIQLLRCYFYGNVYSVTIAMAVIIISAVICRQSCMCMSIT